jgi:hypothetical protein
MVNWLGDEVLVHLLGPFFCGSGGCSLLLFTPSEGGYSLVNEFPISRLPVIVSPGRAHGWNDLVRLESGGGRPASYVRYTFDDKKYVERERTPADEAPEGKRYMSGELKSEHAIPLAPGIRAQ